MRILLAIWRGLRTLAALFASADDDGILVADSCIFKPTEPFTPLSSCEGGAVDFATNDGSSRLLEIATEMEEVFPTYDLSGHRITTVHTHYRRLSSECTASFSASDDCAGSCSGCSGTAAKAKCKARQLKCKGSSIQGISFPFMADPASVLGLLSGKDIEILEFRPPP